jgi:hypothetical protein
LGAASAGLRLVRWPLDDLEFDLVRLAAMPCVQFDVLSGLERGDAVLGALDGIAIQADDQVARPHAGLECRTLHQNIDHGDPAVRIDAELGGLFRREILGHETQPAAHHVTVGQDLFHHASHQVDGNGKADAFGPARGAIEYGGVDADEIPVRVDECAAGVAEIDGCIRLDELLECG